MALTARDRVSPVDVLQVDREYATISYYLEGAKNDLGEPSRTLTQRDTNVKCSIDPMVASPTYIRQSGLREQREQGIVESSVFLMIVNTDVTIEEGDVVTNVDNENFDVLHTTTWYTHQEVFLEKKN